MKEFVETLIRELVDKPEEAHIHEIEGGHTVILELRVAEEDLGKVIGKKGRTAASVRILLAAAAARQGKRYVLEILDGKANNVP